MAKTTIHIYARQVRMYLILSPEKAILDVFRLRPEVLFISEYFLPAFKDHQEVLIVLKPKTN